MFLKCIFFYHITRNSLDNVKNVLFVCHLCVIISKFFLEYPKMGLLGLYHDDPLWLRSYFLIINRFTKKRISFCFGLSDIEEPLAGIYKHSLWHFTYSITT